MTRSQSLLLVAILSLVTINGFQNPPAHSQTQRPAASSSPSPGRTRPSQGTLGYAAQITQAIAWPMVAIVIALLYWRPLGRFLESIGGRVTRVSLFQVQFDLALAARATSPTIDDIRKTSAAMMSDATSQLFRQVQDASPADYVLIDLGSGDEWLTSRLFVGALMLHRMRGLQCVVFTEQTAQSDRRFIALTTPEELRWALAKEFPWLEAAFVRAYVEAAFGQLPIPTAVAMPSLLVTSRTGGLDQRVAGKLVAQFVQLLQSPPAAAPSPANLEDDWTELAEGTFERAQWVTRDLLRKLLPDEAFSSHAPENRDASAADRTQTVLRRRGNFVALLDSDGGFSLLIDRRALLEEVVARAEPS